MKVAAIFLVGPSSVAEKKSVWRARGRLGDDPADRGLKAHVEHAIGFVEHQHLDLSQGYDSTRDQVLEPARSGHQDLGASRRLDLRPEADAAVDGRDPQAPGADDRAQLSDDLAGKLAGWGEDESRGPAGPGLDALGQRDAEGERLARAGGRLDEQVVAGERVAHDSLLDGKGFGDVAAGKRAHHWFGDAEIGK